MKEEFIEKIYSGWLGKMIGVIHGANIEGWTREEIERTFGEISDYPFTFKNFCSDDDINGPAFFQRSILDYGADPSLEELPVYQKENTVIVKKMSAQETKVSDAEYHVRVFFTKEFQTVFYDADETGSIREYPIHVYESEKHHCLHIETELKIQKVEVQSQKAYAGIFVNDI